MREKILKIISKYKMFKVGNTPYFEDMDSVDVKEIYNILMEEL